MKALHLGINFCLAAMLSASVHAQSDLVLAVSEGTSGGLDHAQVIAKYKGMADALARAMKTKVNVVFVREFSTLEEVLKNSKYAFVMARPSDYPARAMRDYGYNFVATAQPQGQCYIVVAKDSPFKTLAEIKGKKIVLPEKIAYMSKFCTAELRNKGIDLGNENVQYVREQQAVTFYLDNKFAEIGAIASYSGVGKKIAKEGSYRILHKSEQQPYFPLVASGKVGAEQIAAVQKELQSLSGTEAGRDLLKRIGVDAFDMSTETKMRELPKWLGL